MAKEKKKGNLWSKIKKGLKPKVVNPAMVEARKKEKAVKKTAKAQKRLSKAGVTVSKETASKSGKIRRGVKGAKVTKGGAYPQYKKKSGTAKKFGKAFSEARKAGKKTFTWDGRSYSTARADDKKKAVKKTPLKRKESQAPPMNGRGDYTPKASPKQKQFETPMADVEATRKRLEKGISPPKKKEKKRLKVETHSERKQKMGLGGAIGGVVGALLGKKGKAKGKAERIVKSVAGLAGKKGGDAAPKSEKPGFEAEAEPETKMAQGGKVESSGGESNPYGWPSTDSRKR